MEGEREIKRLKIAGSGGEAFDLVLTNGRLYRSHDSKIFGAGEVSIPLAAVDSIHYGWKRHSGLLFAAIRRGDLLVHRRIDVRQ